MPTWRPSFDEWLSTHQGIISNSRLQTLGCSPRTVSRMVARGDLIAMQPGVFRSRQWPAGVLQQLAAICARNPRAVIAFTTAAMLWTFRRVSDKRLHVLVPHGSSPALHGAVVHRCRRIDEVDIVERPDGIRVTSPPRTLFDSADLLGVSAARSVMEQILHERMCGLETIIDTFTRLAHPQRPGTTTMAAVIASRPKWRRALQSDLEQRVLEEIERQRRSPRPKGRHGRLARAACVPHRRRGLVGRRDRRPVGHPPRSGVGGIVPRTWGRCESPVAGFRAHRTGPGRR